MSGRREGLEKLFAPPREGGSASPIQRAAFSSRSAVITQHVQPAQLEQAVRINPLGLRISLEASANENGNRTDLKFTGGTFTFWRSSVCITSVRLRILQTSHAGTIELLNGLIKLPYPVPLRLLGSEAAGWLDIEYLSPDGSLRIARGSKGTLFVFTRMLEDE